MLNFIISKLLQICSKEPSLVGRATWQEPARLGLTVTFTPFRAPETSQAGLCASLWDRPAPVLLQAPANHEPSPSAPPPGETLIQHLKQNRRTCSSVWELSRLSLPSTTRLYLQRAAAQGCRQEQGSFSNSLTLAALGEAAGLWLVQGVQLLLLRLGKAVWTCTPKEHLPAHPGLCYPDTTALGEFEAFQKQKSGDLFQPRLFSSCNLILSYFILVAWGVSEVETR